MEDHLEIFQFDDDDIVKYIKLYVKVGINRFNDKYHYYFEKLEVKNIFTKTTIKKLEIPFNEPDYSYINHFKGICTFDSIMTILASCTLFIKWLGELCQQPGTIPVIHQLYQYLLCAHSEVRFNIVNIRDLYEVLLLNLHFKVRINIDKIIRLCNMYNLDKRLLLFIRDSECYEIVNEIMKECNIDADTYPYKDVLSILNIAMHDHTKILDLYVELAYKKCVEDCLLKYIYKYKPLYIIVVDDTIISAMIDILGIEGRRIDHLSFVILKDEGTNSLNIVYDSEKIEDNYEYIRYEIKAFQLATNNHSVAVFPQTDYHEEQHKFNVHNDNSLYVAHDVTNDFIIDNNYSDLIIKNCFKNCFCYVLTDTNIKSLKY